MKGKLTPESYLGVLETHYGRAAAEAWPYLLVAYSLNGDKDKISQFLSSRGEEITRQSQEPLLVKKFFERAVN